MAMVSLRQWREMSNIAKSVSLDDDRLRKIIRENGYDSATINGSKLTDSDQLDQGVVKYILQRAKDQTGEADKFAIRTKTRNEIDKWVLLLGAYVANKEGNYGRWLEGKSSSKKSEIDDRLSRQKTKWQSMFDELDQVQL